MGWRIRLKNGYSARQYTPRWDERRSDNPVVPSLPRHEQTQSIFFAKLPAELRLQVYKLVFGNMRFRWGFMPPATPLYRGYSDGEFVVPTADPSPLRVCQAMRAEIGDSWLRQVLFLAEDQISLIHFLEVNPALRRKIGRICVREHPGGAPNWDGPSSIAMSLMGHSMDAVLLHEILSCLPGLRLDELTILASGDPYNTYRTLGGFVSRGEGYRTLRFVTPNSLVLKCGTLLQPSRLCVNHRVIRRPQPAAWDAEARLRDGETSEAGVELYRSTPQTPEEMVPPETHIVGVTDPDQDADAEGETDDEEGSPSGETSVYHDALEEQPEEVGEEEGLEEDEWAADDSSGGSSDDDRLSAMVNYETILPRPFAVLDPRSREPWAQKLRPDGYTISKPPKEGRHMLRDELERELLFVVSRSRRAAELEMKKYPDYPPAGVRSGKGKADSGPDGEPGRDEAGPSTPGSSQSSSSWGDTSGSSSRSDPSVSSSTPPPNADGQQQLQGWHLRMEETMNLVAYLDRFRFLYPYDGSYADAMDSRYQVFYAIRQDEYDDVENFGDWGVFGCMDRYLWTP